jgi:pyruvate kinase
MNRKSDPSAFDPRQTAARLTGDLISVREKIVTLAGPHLAEATAFLDRVLRRMDRHPSKKSPQLGPLQSWQDT